MPSALDLTPDLAGLTAAVVYLVVFGFVFVESGLLVGFLLPGDSLLFGAGLVGTARMPYRRFLPANVVGAVVWGPGLLLLGYYAATDSTLRHSSYAVAVAFISGSLMLAAVSLARRRR